MKYFRVTKCLDPPSGGDFVPPSCPDRAHFVRFSVLQKAVRYKKLEVRERLRIAPSLGALDPARLGRVQP